MSCCAEHHVLASGSTWLLGFWSSSPYLATALMAPLVLLLLMLYPALLLLTPKERALPPSAHFYTSIDDDEPRPLPKLTDDGRPNGDSKAIQLSIIVPAYNEESRLTIMLDEAHAHLQQLKVRGEPLAGSRPFHKEGSAADGLAVEAALQHKLETFEILIVDDGSRDNTANVAKQWAADKKLGASEFRLVRLGRNCGKGKAVRHGVLHARGNLLLFCDADGATRFSDIDALLRELARIVTPQGHGIVCGSRAHLVGSEAVVKRSFARNLLMHSFHFILSLLMRPPNPFALAGKVANATSLSRLMTSQRKHDGRLRLPSQPQIRDTQCGFKLLTRPSARVIFPLAHIDRWIFDVELLLLAEMASRVTLSSDAMAAQRATAARQGDEAGAAAAAADPLLRLPLPISEVAVEWKEIAGSKIDILKDSVKMGLDLIVIRLNYALGRWQRPAPLHSSLSTCCDSDAPSEQRNGSAHSACNGKVGHAHEH